MRSVMFACLLAAVPMSAHANDWEKFYKPAPAGSTPILPADHPPEIVPLSQDSIQLVNSMWQRGFAPIGTSSFNSPNAKTSDAVHLGVKLKAAYIAMATQLQSSRTVDIPMTTPTTTTSYTNGNASATGSGGYANGTYSGTTTTYGTNTTYIPIAVNRFEKVAVYFGPLAKQGVGLLMRLPTPEEVVTLETRHLLIVRAVRDGSTADTANMLEGDMILTVNGDPATFDTFRAAVAAGKPIAMHVMRRGQPRDVSVPVAQ